MSTTEVTGDSAVIREFKIGFDESELTGLRRRIADTRWPERETVADDSQGVPLATMQDLARYWATDYDWRGCEARLNALPNFLTEIDGLDIHFIHVRSRLRASAWSRPTCADTTCRRSRTASPHTGPASWPPTSVASSRSAAPSLPSWLATTGVEPPRGHSR